MDIKSNILSIIINLFSSDLYSMEVNWIEKWRFKQFQKKVTSIVENIVNKHDGSVLTTDSFENFLRYYHPIEKLFLNISGEGECKSKKQFIEEQNKLFFDSYNSDKESPLERSIFKELFEKLYDTIDNYYRKTLSKNDKYLIGVVEKTRNFLGTEIEEGTDRVIQTVGKKMDEVKDMLSSIRKIDDMDIIWSIYSSFSKAIMEGRSSEVYSLYPLLNGKSKDLELGIAYLLKILSDISVEDVSFEIVQNKIDSEQIYVDLAQKTIYIALLRKDKDLLNSINERNLIIYEIKCRLLTEKYEAFYTLETERKDGMFFITYKLLNNYPEYEWIVKKICMFSVLDQPVINATDCIESMLGESDSIIDQVLLVERQVYELGNMMIVDDCKKANDLIDKFEALKSNINNIPKDIQRKFYCAYIRIGLLISNEKAQSISEMIPNDMKNDGEVAMLCMQVKIEEEKVDIQSVLDLCIKNDQYWLFNNYLIKIANKAPKEAKELIDLHLFIIDKDPTIFLIYAQLVHRLEGTEKASELFRKYESKYGNYIEFWIDKLRIDYTEEELSSATERWFNAKFQYLTRDGNLEFLRLLMLHKRYKDVLRGVLLAENIDNLSCDFYKIKARALLYTKHEIEALAVYKKLFEDKIQDDEVAYYIMALSINNKRAVSSEVVQYSKNSEDSSLLALTATYEEINGNHEEAETLLLKALLRNHNDDSSVFGRYLGLHVREDHSEEIKISGVAADTTVHCIDGQGKTKIICVHSKKVLPTEPYVWENAEHIYTETAIQKGLLRKKKNDSVELDEGHYRICHIESLDAFLFHVSTDHLVNNGSVKLIYTSMNEDGKIDVESFKEQVKETLGSTSSKVEWLEQYKNINEMPASIAIYKGYVRFTYTQLIQSLVQDSAIPYREIYGSVKKADKYILSAAALVILKEIDFNPKKIAKQIVIPTSLQKVVSDDTDKVIIDNNRELVASMGIQNDQLYFFETSDDEKQEYMTQAVELKNYTAEYEAKENVIDLLLQEGHNLDIKEFMGIADYDALCLARKESYTLVAAEVPYIILANLSEVNVQTICIADFLNDVCNDLEELFKYIKKMLDFRFVIPFTDSIVIRLSSVYDDSGELEKEELLRKWQQILMVPFEDKEYKKMLSGICKGILEQTKERVSEGNPIWSALLYAVVKYSGYSVRVGFSDGKIITQMIKDEDEAGDE